MTAFDVLACIGIAAAMAAFSGFFQGMSAHARITRVEHWIKNFEDWQRGHTHHLAPPPPPPWENPGR